MRFTDFSFGSGVQPGGFFPENSLIEACESNPNLKTEGGAPLFTEN
jgi:hypothetical protein